MMSRYVAFLRAVNVGGRTIKMDALRMAFESAGFTRVETFIASGNVIFEAADADETVLSLEARIEAHLRLVFGYEVTTILRTLPKLCRIASFRPFADLEFDRDGHSLFVVFLANPPGPDAIARVVALRTEFDEFLVDHREIYWLCRTKISDSKVSGAKLEKAAGMPATARNSTTVRKLAAKYGPA